MTMHARAVSAHTKPGLPSDLVQLRSLVGMQAVVIETLMRRLQSAEIRISDLHALVAGLPPAEHLLAALKATEASKAPAAMRPTMASIADMIAGQTGMTVDDLRGPSRLRPQGYARSMFCGISRRAGYSLAQIGHWVNRDHTTVLASSRKEDKARAYFAEMRATLNEVQG